MRPERCTGQPNRCDAFTPARQWFPPQGVDIRVLGADRQGGTGRTAKVERRVRLLKGPDLAVGTGEATELAVIVEGRVAHPNAEYVQVFGCATVARVMRREVAITSLVGITPTRDQMERNAPPVSWSSVAASRAVTVGCTNPGRCAIRKPNFVVCCAA